MIGPPSSGHDKRGHSNTLNHDMEAPFWLPQFLYPRPMPQNSIAGDRLHPTHDTARFAVNSIQRWWDEMGASRFPKARKLMLTADGGGSNSSRNRLWKVELQGLANEIGLPIHICHFPPGTSKWNKIEHRLFCFITKNWRGRPLESHQAIVELISSTKTNTGLTVRAALDENEYETGIKVTDEELGRVNLIRSDFHGDWNYSIKPQRK
jgi:hypothetical protein